MALEPGRQFDFSGRSPEVTDLNAYREARAQLRSSKDPIQVAQYAHNPYAETQNLANRMKSSGWSYQRPAPSLRDRMGEAARYMGLIEDREPGK